MSPTGCIYFLLFLMGSLIFILYLKFRSTRKQGESIPLLDSVNSTRKHKNLHPLQYPEIYTPPISQMDIEQQKEYMDLWLWKATVVRNCLFFQQLSMELHQKTQEDIKNVDMLQNSEKVSTYYTHRNLYYQNMSFSQFISLIFDVYKTRPQQLRDMNLRKVVTILGRYITEYEPIDMFNGDQKYV